jgi:hypothetical protein
MAVKGSNRAKDSVIQRVKPAGAPTRAQQVGNTLPARWTPAPRPPGRPTQGY